MDALTASTFPEVSAIRGRPDWFIFSAYPLVRKFLANKIIVFLIEGTASFGPRALEELFVSGHWFVF